MRRFIGYRLKRTYSSIRGDLLQRLQPLDLHITTYSTLVLIVDNPGYRQSDLALALDIKRSNMVAIVDELEQRGWVRRKRAVGDRRAYALYATTSGGRVCQKALEINAKSEAELLACLNTQERRKLEFLLEKIRAAAEA